jgi:hypothetical protein
MRRRSGGLRARDCPPWAGRWRAGARRWLLSDHRWSPTRSGRREPGDPLDEAEGALAVKAWAPSFLARKIAGPCPVGRDLADGCSYFDISSMSPPSRQSHMPIYRRCLPIHSRPRSGPKPPAGTSGRSRHGSFGHCFITPASTYMGAKLGASWGVPLQSCMDCHGHRALSLWNVWTAADPHRPLLDIYGSEGWGFKSSRARCTRCLVAMTINMSPSEALSPVRCCSCC